MNVMHPVSNAESFWQAYLTSQPGLSQPNASKYQIWHFGDTKDVAAHCAHLVRAGIKTATSGLIWEMEADGEQIPQPGDLAVVVDLSGEPYCIIELTECSIQSFAKVDKAFAFDYGEGDRSLEGWRQDAWEYFAPICQNLGYVPSETMLLACQRFRVVYPVLETGASQQGMEPTPLSRRGTHGKIECLQDESSGQAGGGAAHIPPLGGDTR